MGVNFAMSVSFSFVSGPRMASMILFARAATSGLLCVRRRLMATGPSVPRLILCRTRWRSSSVSDQSARLIQTVVQHRVLQFARQFGISFRQNIPYPAVRQVTEHLR